MKENKVLLNVENVESMISNFDVVLCAVIAAPKIFFTVVTFVKFIWTVLLQEGYFTLTVTPYFFID
jgi:hypothetical protein